MMRKKDRQNEKKVTRQCNEPYRMTVNRQTTTTNEFVRPIKPARYSFPSDAVWSYPHTFRFNCKWRRVVRVNYRGDSLVIVRCLTYMSCSCISLLWWENWTNDRVLFFFKYELHRRYLSYSRQRNRWKCTKRKMFNWILKNRDRMSNLHQLVEHLLISSRISLVIPSLDLLSIDPERIDIPLLIEPRRTTIKSNHLIDETNHFKSTSYCSTYHLIVT